MPQMMPMMWLLMSFGLIFLLLMISSFIYFFYYPLIHMKTLKSLSYKNWLWTW